MGIDASKTATNAAWAVALGALALSDVVTSQTGLLLLLGFGFVPVLLIWLFWNPPTPVLVEAVGTARD